MSRVRDTLVRGGADVQLVNVARLPLADGSFARQFDHDRGYVQHAATVVYREMMLQICSDYPGLPDVRTMDVDEIVFFYDGIRSALRKRTAK